MRVWFALVWTLIFVSTINGSAQRTAADFVKQAQTKEQHKDYDGAIVSCNQAIQLNPKDPKAYYSRGGAKFDKGDYGGAIADCTKAIDLNPRYAEAYSGRGAARGKKGDYDGSIADSNQAIKLNPKDANAYSNRAAVEMNAENYNASIADANRAIQLSPGFASAFNNRGGSKVGLGDFTGAIADFSQAIRNDPKDGSFYRNRALNYNCQSNYHAAIADYDRAIQINPQDAEAYKGRGATRELQKDWARALTDYYRSGEVAQTQETKDLVHLLIWVVRTRLGQPAVANQELSFYLGKRSRSWSAKAGAFLLGKIRESEFLSATNSYDPHKIRVLQCKTWYYIGIKHFLAKETNVAKECFAKCLAMRPLAADEWVYAQGELRILNASG